MAGNPGKIVDTFPIIRAAGLPPKSDDSVAECLRHYSLVDKIDALKHDGDIWELPNRHPHIKYKMPPLQSGKLHCGIYTESRPLLRPPVETRFQTMISDLKDTTYNTYWNKNLGKSREETGGLPLGMVPLETTFGEPHKEETPLKGIVNPPKTPYEVLWDSQVGHELYKKTHNDYNPSEQIDRKYLSPAYNPNKCFGKRRNYDPRGIMARCALNWFNKEPVVTVRTTQADVAHRRAPVLGTCLTPNNNIESVEVGHVFGKPSLRSRYDMDALLKDPDCPPPFVKKEFHKWMGCLNQLRMQIKKKDVFKFDVKNFSKRVLYYDKDSSGWVPKNLLYDLLHKSNVNWEEELLEPLLICLGILIDDKINYIAFMSLLDVNKPMPDIDKINDIPEKNLQFLSTAQVMYLDYLSIDNSKLRAAGIPSKRFDLPNIELRPGQCEANRGDMGEETNTAALINPSIFTSYGLSHWDFFRPFKPETLKTLFERAGYTFPEDTFDRLYKIGEETDKTGGVCVDTFNKLVKEKGI